jgi:hypothetical protein
LTTLPMIARSGASSYHSLRARSADGSSVCSRASQRLIGSVR